MKNSLLVNSRKYWKKSERTKTVTEKKMTKTAVLVLLVQGASISRKKHASNIENNKDRIQDIPFRSSDMDELRQPSSPLGVVNETLDETIIINENRQQAIITRKLTSQNFGCNSRHGAWK